MRKPPQDIHPNPTAVFKIDLQWKNLANKNWKKNNCANTLNDKQGRTTENSYAEDTSIEKLNLLW